MVIVRVTHSRKNECLQKSSLSSFDLFFVLECARSEIFQLVRTKFSEYSETHSSK